MKVRTSRLSRTALSQATLPSNCYSEQRLGFFSAQILANTAWAFATTARSGELLFVALVGMAGQRVTHFSAQNIANTAWAFATSARSNELGFLSFVEVGRAASGAFQHTGSGWAAAAEE